MSYVWVGMDVSKRRNPVGHHGIYKDMTIPKVITEVLAMLKVQQVISTIF